MADVFKFPNGGYDVVICKRQDILDCIDDNIIDKEIALAIINQCEIDAADCIRQGRWTGLPFIGNVRVPKHIQMINSSEQQALIKDAKDTLNKDAYIMFRKKLIGENINQVKQERYYKYIVSIEVNKKRALYRKLCDEKGEVYARIFLYASAHITATNNEYINIEDNG